jgi:hypothetical protein
MWDFLESIKFSDIIKCGKGRRETTMSTKDLSFNNSSEWEVIEEICEHFPYVVIFVFPDTLIVEAIALSDGPGLMVSS